MSGWKLPSRTGIENSIYIFAVILSSDGETVGNAETPQGQEVLTWLAGCGRAEAWATLPHTGYAHNTGWHLSNGLVPIGPGWLLRQAP